MTTKMRRFAAAVVIALVCGGITWLAMAESGDYATMGYDTPNGYSFWRVNSSGYLVPGADNTLDIGTAALSPRNLYCDGTATIATLSVTGAVTQAGAATFQGNVTLGDATTDVVTFVSTSVVVPAAGTVLISTSSNQSGTNILAIDGTNKRVGIGSASPAVLLDVNGAMTVAGAAILKGNTTIGDATTDVLVLVSTDVQIPAAGTVIISTSANNSGTTIMALDGTNKRVGIGSSSPAVALDVAGAVSMTGNLSVAAGGSLTATLLTKTTTQMATYTPIAAGVLIYESTNMRVCVSTGTGAGAVVTSSSAVTACYP